MREFISSEITYSILKQTLLIFGTIKEGIMEVLEECLGSFRSEIVAITVAHTFTFCEFQACRAPKFFRKEPIASRHWLVDVVNAFRASSCPDGTNVRLSSCLLKDISRYWWEEVVHALGGKAIESMTWEDFVTRFWSEFAPVIEVQQLAREFQDLCQTNETVAEITAIFHDRELLVPQYVADEEMKKERYHEMLRSNIRMFVSRSSCKKLDDMKA